MIAVPTAMAIPASPAAAGLSAGTSAAANDEAGTQADGFASLVGTLEEEPSKAPPAASAAKATKASTATASSDADTGVSAGEGEAVVANSAGAKNPGAQMLEAMAQADASVNPDGLAAQTSADTAARPDQLVPAPDAVLGDTPALAGAHPGEMEPEPALLDQEPSTALADSAAAGNAQADGASDVADASQGLANAQDGAALATNPALAGQELAGAAPHAPQGAAEDAAVQLASAQGALSGEVGAPAVQGSAGAKTADKTDDADAAASDDAQLGASSDAASQQPAQLALAVAAVQGQAQSDGNDAGAAGGDSPSGDEAPALRTTSASAISLRDAADAKVTAAANGDDAGQGGGEDAGAQGFRKALAETAAGDAGGKLTLADGTARSDGNAPTGAWLSQTMTSAAARPSALPYPAAAQASTTTTGEVSVREGQFGTDMGVQIAKALDAGSNDLLIKLDPRDMGRIDVRLSFDHSGVLRATMSAHTSGATDLLRRESGDLMRSLNDAGIRADGQSLRFDTRSGEQSGQGAGQGWAGSQGFSGQRGNGGQGQSQGRFAGSDEPVYRSLSGSGHIDLIA